MKPSVVLSISLTLAFCSFGPYGISDARELSEPAGSSDSLLVATARDRIASFCPILMYDSDVGFGFGGRGMIKNYLARDESFDLMVFITTKGEQTYKYIFSIPDTEIRQGSIYGASLDLELEYSKVLKSNFFGFGIESEDNEWQFPRETSLLSATIGHAFTSELIGEVAISYSHVSVYDFEESGVMTEAVVGTGENVTAVVGAGMRWDTRESQIHPEQGWVASGRVDLSETALGSDYTFQRYRLELSKYLAVFSSRHIVAGRLWMQHVEGNAPYYEASIIGGGDTARGFKADRFVDTTMSLASLEYRLMIRYPVSAVFFVDAGRVYPMIDEVTFRDWKTNLGGGLRYHMEGFIVRFDAGFSDEGTRVFFNFGHVF